MSAQVFEVVLARLYTDDAFRDQFIADPRQSLAGYDLTEDELKHFEQIDVVGLVMASTSIEAKMRKRTKGRVVRHDDTQPLISKLLKLFQR